MKAIILAGGFGTRIAHISKGVPKALMKVAGKAVLERQIEMLLKAGIHDIRIGLYYEAEQIKSFCEKKWPGKFEFVTEPRPLGTGGGIKFAAQDLREEFLVLNGDVLCDLDLQNFLQKGANIIMCAQVEDARDFGLLKIKKNKIKDFLEKPREKISGFVNCGFYLLRHDVFEGVEKEEFLMEKEIFPRLAKEGRLKAYVHSGYWIDIGTEERYRRANDDLGSGLV